MKLSQRAPILPVQQSDRPQAKAQLKAVTPDAQRIVYLIQTHTLLPQIERLVRTIRRGSPGSLIVLSHHIASFDIPDETFRDLDDVVVLRVEEAYRGDFSLVAPYLDAIGWIAERGVRFDWLVNMSGQCYPVRPLAQFETLLSRNESDAYMQCFEAFTPSPENIWSLDEARHRYEYQYARLRKKPLPDWVRKALSIPRRAINSVQPWIEIDTMYGLMIGRSSRGQLFNERFRCFGGSQFKSISKACAEYLLKFTQERPDVVDYFRRTIIPDEAYVQTVIANNPDFRISGNNLYYLDWGAGLKGIREH